MSKKSLAGKYDDMVKKHCLTVPEGITDAQKADLVNYLEGRDHVKNFVLADITNNIRKVRLQLAEGATANRDLMEKMINTMLTFLQETVQVKHKDESVKQEGVKDESVKQEGVKDE